MTYDANQNYTINDVVKLMLQLHDSTNGRIDKIEMEQKYTNREVGALKIQIQQVEKNLGAKIDGVESILRDDIQTEISDLAIITKLALDKKADLEYA